MSDEDTGAAVVAENSVEVDSELEDSVELEPVPFQRRVRRTQSEETKALDALDGSFSNYGIGAEDAEARPAPRSNRVSVLAAGRLQRTTNMRDMFENMAKKSNPTPVQRLPAVRRARVVQPTPVKDYSLPEMTVKSEESRPLPAPRLIVNPNFNNNKDVTSDYLANGHTDAPSPTAFNDVQKPLDFSDPKIVKELIEFLENGGEESRPLVQNLLDHEIIHEMITEEMVGRDGFVGRIKSAAESKQIDMTELTFALLSDEI